MRAGLLNKKIDIYTQQIVTNDFGHIKDNYSKTYSTRAYVKYNSGSRQFENNEIFFSSNVTFEIRKYVPVVHTSRIKYNNNFYRIISIEESDAKNNLIIITELINE